MFSSRSSRLASVLLGVMLSPLVAAQNTADPHREDFYNLSLAELGKIQISIATGSATAIEQAPATASVITAAEIQAMGARNLDDILEMVPGLHVSLSSLSRLDSVYSIRGIHTGFNAQVLLLINGEPLQNALQGGRPTLLRLSAANIERVEVIRGPGSAIYGADAYAGVINVVTRDTYPVKHARAGIRVGSFDSRELWASTADSWNDWNLSAHFAYQESDGDQERIVERDLQTMLDEIFGTQVSLAPGALATGYQNLDLRLRAANASTQASLWYWQSRDAQVGAGGAQALDHFGSDDIGLWKLDVGHSLNSANEHWQHSINASYMRYEIKSHFKLFPSGSLLPIGADGNLDFAAPQGLVLFSEGLIGKPGGVDSDAHVYWVSNYTGFEHHRWRIALGYRYQALDNRESKNFGPGILDGSEGVVDGTLTDVTGTEFIYLPDSRRRLYYLSVQDEWQFAPRWMLTAGLRHDHYEDVGNTTNPRVALVWATNDRLTTKVLYGSAFRAPSISELGFINNPVSLGNQALEPERIDTYELSFNLRLTEHLQSNLTLFTYRSWDMIEFVPDPDATTSTAQNARDQDAKGFEWEWQWKPSAQLWLTGSYSWQDAKDSDTGATIPDAPGQLFKLSGYWEFSPKWSANLQALRVADRDRAAGDLRPAVSNYNRVNLSLRRTAVLPDLDMALTLRNLADSKTYEPSSDAIPGDYPLAGRSISLEFNYSFR